MSKQHCVIICLRDPDRAKHLATATSSSKTEAIVAQSSDQLHHLVNYQQVDLIVLEHEMRGFLTGLDIVERMFDDLLRPAIVLLAQASADVRDRAQQLGINRIVASESSIAEIRDAIDCLLATSRMSQVVIPAAARQIVQQCSDIRPLPQLLTKLAAYLDADGVSLTELAQDIAVDARITGDLLRVINSSAFGLNTKVTHIQDAVKLLGVRRTVSMIISSSVFNAQRSMSDSIPSAERLWFNQRSVLIAAAAATFSRVVEEISPETAYVLGLFQDLGILVQAKLFGNKYIQLLRRVRRIGQLRLELCEREEFKVSHAEVSAALLQKWNMPANMVSLVLAHAGRRREPNRSQTDQKFLRVMRIGEAIANLSDGHSPQRFPVLAKLLAEYDESKTDQCRLCIAASVDKALESCKLFALPIPDESELKQLTDQLHDEDWDVQAELGDSDDGELDSEPMAPSFEPQSPPNFGSDGDTSYESAGESVAVATADSDERRIRLNRRTAPATAQSASADELQQFPGLGLVVIDDDPVVLDYFRLCFQRHGIAVTCLHSFDSSNDDCTGANIYFVDIHLGKEDGTQTVRTMRKSGIVSPIIMISSDRRREAVAAAILAGANDYIVKPFDPPTLLERVIRHIGSDDLA